MDIWSISYMALLVITVSVALYYRDSDYVWISIIMASHQVGSLFIGYAAETTQPILDFLSDIIICSILIHFFIEVLVVRVLLVLFAGIAVFAYLPRAFGLYTQDFYLEVMGSISFLMLIVILGGISSGTRHRKRSPDDNLHHQPDGPTNVYNVGPSRNARSILAAHGIEVQDGEEVSPEPNSMPKRKD